MATFEPGPTEDALRDLCQKSPYESDGGELIGKHPGEVPLEILSRYHGGNNPLGPFGRGASIVAAGKPLRSASVRRSTALRGPSGWAATLSGRSGCCRPTRSRRWLNG